MIPNRITQYLEAPFEAWKPYLLLALAVTFTNVALLSPPRSLFIRFIPPYVLTLWSLLCISPITSAWSPPYLDYSLGITCIVNLIILPRILLWESGIKSVSGVSKPQKITQLGDGDGSTSLSQKLSAAASIWNNPRNLPSAKTYPSKLPLVSLLLFGARRTARIGLLLFIHFEIVERLAGPYFAEVELEDLSPNRESLFRRLIWYSADVSQYEITLRMIMPIHWIWMNFVCLECYHDILSIIFVCIMQIDDEEDWPPLFGSIAEAYTVKRFWGKFWHRITAHNMMALGVPLSRRFLRCKPGSPLEKTAIAFVVFLLSGTAHAIVAWRTAEGSEIRDIMFYVANFAAAAAEILISRALQYSRSFRLLKSRGFFDRTVVRNLGRAMGFLWVYLWFMWIVPKWQFPKLHSQRVAQLEMEIAFFFGELS